ncbi:hypothetical protein Syun_003306 [Stephania yunnanensis]|uniref:Pentatricopeptide repeat-containing protein n=1 Tax=Stephania yunnanensis TaxID=152371 RepID=A0AAP0L4S7_9MAGN
MICRVCDSTRIPTTMSLLTFIDNCQSLCELRQIHSKCIIFGLTYGQFILAKLISSFISDKNLDYATQLFLHTREPDTFIYNSMIRIYSSSETPLLAISTYNNMRISDTLCVNNLTFPFVFRACANFSALSKGREIHGTIIRIGYKFDRFIHSSLLNLYAVCRETDYARQVFDEFEGKDLVFWNAMIMSYTRAGWLSEAFETFREMLEVKNIRLRTNEVTVLSLISACVVAKDIELGRVLHGYIVKNMDFAVKVKLGAAIIDFYAKRELMDEARGIFEEMAERNTVVWNTMISGYSQNGYPSEAIDLFREMLVTDVSPDHFTISAILSACAQLGALNLGNWVREFAEKKGFRDVFVGTAVLDMYAKCGEITLAKEVFYQMEKKNVATWNAILSGFASHGQAHCTLDLFNEMESCGFIPDSVTFIAILNACSHAGLVDEGHRYFNLMVKHYKIVPRVEHYGCMVDLLGRAGLLGEAKHFIEKMDIEPNEHVWGAMLSACVLHHNVEMSEWAAYHVLQSDKVDSGSYILLSNVYATVQNFEKVRKVRNMMEQRGVPKHPGSSVIEVGDDVHEFVAADKSHPSLDEIYSLLDELHRRMKMEGYVPVLPFEYGS